MTDSLVRCSTCKRHIYATETSCPFCARSGIVTPVAMIVAAGLAIAGCGGQPSEVKNADEAAPNQPAQVATEQPPPTVAPAPDAPIYNVAPAYGGPPPIMTAPAVLPPPAAYGGPPPPSLQPPMPPK